MDKQDSSLEDDGILEYPQAPNYKGPRKFLISLIICIISIVVVIIVVIVLAVVLTRKKKKKAPEVQDKITFSGLDDAQILQGKYFNCLEGVKAITSDGLDLTSKISVTGELNTAKEGDYALTYELFDNNNQKKQKQRNIKVLKNPNIGIKKPVPLYSLDNGQTYDIAKGCKVISNSGKNDVQKSVDGDIKTRWESEVGLDDVYLTIDLGEKLTINNINIFWEAAYAANYELLTSEDGNNWDLIENVTNSNELEFETISGQKVYPNRFSFEKGKKTVTARFVKINCLKRITNYGYSIFEFEVIGPTGTVVPTEYYPDLFDAKNDRSKDWKRPNEQWLKFDLGSVKKVDTIRLAFQNYLFPAEYKVLYAAEDENYKQVKTRNLPYSGDTFSLLDPDSEDEASITVSARYFKIEMSSLRFYAACYRLLEVNFKLKEETVTIEKATASSSKKDHGPELAIDKDDSTFWENDNNVEYQTIDLEEVKKVGRVDLYWRGDDGGKGKYYDLEISSDNEGRSWTTVFRQIHGATPIQKVYLYKSCRFIRIKDYQSPSNYQFMLEGAVVHSRYPASSLEGPVEYDVTLKFPEKTVINHGNGSYVTGGTDFPTSRLIAFLDDSLRSKPVPSNGWWQGLLMHNKGYNMYMNPLTATFEDNGLWLTNPGAGFYDGLVPGTGSQTIDIDAHDIHIGYDELDEENSEVRVTGYSDFGVSAVLTDDSNIDKLTVFLSQGSLYAYMFFAEPEKAVIKASTLVAVYDIEGNEIMHNYTGDSIVVVVRTHSSYVDGVRRHYQTDSSGNKVIVENEPIYEERFYVVSVPEETEFTIINDVIHVKMQKGNYLSVGAVSQKNEVNKDGSSLSSKLKFPKDEINQIHQHGYSFVIDTSCLYSFDNVTNNVTTEFHMKTFLVRQNYPNEAYTAFLPHHLAHSTYKDGYVYKSVRGDCRSYAGNTFVIKDQFHGIVPTFCEPDDDGYDTKSLYDLLQVVYNHNGGDKKPEESNLISGDPYWQGKNLHPLSMATLVADQIGATNMRDEMLDKIEYILSNWFTYNETDDEDKSSYFYYDQEWGTLYYKNSEFGAGVNLADHHFTYGYYLLATGILTSFRPQFAEKWSSMIDLLIRDYMNPSHEDPMFPHIRNFDCFAGHGWAGGYADNNGGNNQESAGEALNSWVGAYFYATAIGNETLRQTAIYGYTTELSATKHYWFNYYNDFLSSYPYGATGQVYGASNFYGTFFNGEPLYVYGIHLIPGQEYLTSLGLNQDERNKLKTAIEKLKHEQSIWELPEADRSLHAWQHIFIPVISIYDHDEAINWYNDCLKTIGNIGNDQEQYNVYWIMHGIKSVGYRTTEIWTENGQAATIYVKNNAYKAVCWNPTQSEQKFVFKNNEKIVGSAIIPPKTLLTVDPFKETNKPLNYIEDSEFSIEDSFETENTQISDGKLIFNENGYASYHLTFGEKEEYRTAIINFINQGENEGEIHFFIDDKEIEISKKNGYYESSPFSITFKHTITLRGAKITVDAFKFVKQTLVKSTVKMTATASSSNGNENTPEKAVDGDMETRWESGHNIDSVQLDLSLEEPTIVYQLQVHWEAASAKEYRVLFSDDGKEWTEAAHVNSNQGKRTDFVTPSIIKKINFIRIDCISRNTNYGYSIYEVEIYNF